MTVNEKIDALRGEMKKNNIDAYIIVSPDAHQSEYIADHWGARSWISGFDGSAGSVVVTQNAAKLWADGRYYIQAAKQIEGTCVELFKMGLDGVPLLHEWIKDELPEGSVVGFDGRTVSINMFEKMEKEFKVKSLKTELAYDLAGEIWKDRPALPAHKIFDHDVKFCGKSRPEKLKDVREQMQKKGAASYLLTSLDDIAWLFNLRGNDVVHTPVFYAYAFIDMDNEYLFVSPEKVDDDIRQKLTADGITLKPYEEVFEFLKTYKAKTMFVNPDRVSVYLKTLIPSEIDLIKDTDITTTLKGTKSDAEIASIRNSQVKDGAAMVQFIKWLKEEVGKAGLEEADLHHKLAEFRSKYEHSMGPSFSTIAGYMANAAAMHYHPIKGESAVLKPEGMVLIDTGGQYLDGTTDITRTIILGPVSAEMKKDFTTVLRSHIGLASAKFMYGATGGYLEILSRGIMWEQGMDYKCGTGHGVGFFLSVHEGPHGFRMAADSVKLEKGMIITNEPGIYKEGVWGIRTENTVLVCEDYKTSDGQFMKFETISYCPIDLDGIEPSLMSEKEKEWLNTYHKTVYEKLSPMLDDEHKEWLKTQTKAI